MAAELVFNGLLGLVILFFLAQALLLPASDNPADTFGAGGFPAILGVIALIVLAAITLRVIRAKRQIKASMTDAAQRRQQERDRVEAQQRNRIA